MKKLPEEAAFYVCIMKLFLDLKNGGDWNWAQPIGMASCRLLIVDCGLYYSSSFLPIVFSNRSNIRM